MSSQINITKKDVLWSYAAQFFTLATGIIVLPLILRLLSADEVGFNYLMLSVGSIIGLFDFGFSGQLGRNLTYIYSGANELKKNGISKVENNSTGKINYTLLVKTIKTSKKIYRIISLVALVVMLSLGTIYMYHVTNEFTTVDNALIIWVVFCFSSFFNLYFLYFNSFLLGKGLVKESKKATIYSKIVQIIITIALLLLNFRLLGVVIANLLAPFVFRYLSSKSFYTSELRQQIKQIKVSNKEIKDIFLILWYNMKKAGIIAVLSSVTTYLSTFILGFYWNLPEVASYGLMIQLGGIISSLSAMMFSTNTPQFSYFFVNNEMDKLKQRFSISMFTFYVLFITGSILFLALPYVLTLIGSNTKLPATLVLIIYSVLNLFAWNQSLYSQLLMAENDFTFFKAATICGLLNLVFTFIALLCGMDILGVVIMQNIPIVLIMDWKWPIYVSRKYNISFASDIVRGGLQFVSVKLKKA